MLEAQELKKIQDKVDILLGGLLAIEILQKETNYPENFVIENARKRLIDQIQVYINVLHDSVNDSVIL